MAQICISACPTALGKLLSCTPLLQLNPSMMHSASADLQLMWTQQSWEISSALGVSPPLLFRLQKATSLCNLTLHGGIGSGGQYDFEHDETAYANVITLGVTKLLVYYNDEY